MFLFLSTSDLYLNTSNPSLYLRVFKFINDNYGILEDTVTTMTIIEMFYIVIEIKDIDEKIVLAYFDLLFTFLQNVNVNDNYIETLGKRLSTYNNLLINYPKFFTLFLEKLYTLTLDNSISLIIIENYLPFTISYLFECYQEHIEITKLLFLLKCDALMKKNDYNLLYSELQECEISIEIIYLIISLAFYDKKKQIVFLNRLNSKNYSPNTNNNHNENLLVNDNENNNNEINSSFKSPIYKNIHDFDLYKDLLQICVDLLTIHSSDYYFKNELDNKELFIFCYKFMFSLFQEIIQFSSESNNIKEYSLACSCFASKRSLYGELVKYFISTYPDEMNIVIDDILSITNFVLVKYDNPFLFEILNEIDKSVFDFWESLFKKIMYYLFENKKDIESYLYTESSSFLIENIANLFYFILNNLSTNNDNNLKIYFENEINCRQFLDKTKSFLKGECVLYINALFTNINCVSNQNNITYEYTYKTISELYFDILIKMYNDLVYDIKSNFYRMLIKHIQHTFILVESNAHKKTEDFKKKFIAFSILDTRKYCKKLGIDKQKINKLEMKLRNKIVDNGIYSFYFLLKIVLCCFAFENSGDLEYLLEEMSLITVYNVFIIRKESQKFMQFENIFPKVMKKNDRKILKLLGKMLDQFFISDFSISIEEEELTELLFTKFKVIFKDNFVVQVNHQQENLFQEEDEIFSSNSDDNSFEYNNVRDIFKNANTLGSQTNQNSFIFTTKQTEIKDDDFISHLKLFIKELTTIDEIKDNQDIYNNNNNILSLSFNEKSLCKSTKTLDNKAIIIGNNSIYERPNTTMNINQININSNYNLQSLSLNNNSNDNLNDNNNNINNNPLNTTKYGNYFHQEKIYSFDTIDKSYSLFYPKRQLLLNIFSLFFNYNYFHNNTFIQMKLYYNNLNSPFKSNKHMKTLNYPSSIKNYSNNSEPPLFLKQNLLFFESPFFTISHKYFLNQRNLLLHPVNQFKLNKIEFYQKPLPNLSGRSHRGVLITPSNNKYMNIYFEYKAIILKENKNEPILKKGNFDYILSEFPIYLFSNKFEKEFIFHSEHKVKPSKVLLLFYNEINVIISRRYLLQWQAVEIFMKNGKSYFLNLYTDFNAKDFIIKAINSGITVIQKEDIEQQFINYTSQWNNNEINTYQYLMFVNCLGTRTYKDPNQYPICPWILKNYTNIFKPLINYSFRDFTYPVSCQEESKRINFQTRYIELIDNPKWRSHFGSHYSTGAFVYYYLMRTYPFCNCLIQLQNYALEHSNRMFSSLLETKKIIEDTCDSRELTPEFFSNIHNLINLNCILFGKRKLNDFVDDISFTDIHNYLNISIYVKFIIEHQRLLNRFSLRNEIIKWIDFIFGYRQLLQEPDSCVIFQKYSYEQVIDLNEKLAKLKNKYANNEDLIRNKMISKINLILNFGMTPYQIYTQNIFKNNFKKNSNLLNNNQQLLILSQKYLQSIRYISILFFTIFNKNDLTICITSPIIKNLQPKIQIQLISTNTQNKINNDISVVINPFQYYTLNTIKSSSESSQAFIYFIREQSYYFIITRYSDCSIHLVAKQTKNKKEIIKKYITESFVTCICKGKNLSFYTGMQNGKLIQWLFSYKDLSINQVRSIYAQLSPISVVYYFINQNVIITSGTIYKNYYGKYETNKENNIYIRKAYDFELITPIEINPKEKVLCIKVSQFNLIYVLVYYSFFKKDNSKMKIVERTKIVGYTLSGIKFAESCEGEYSNFSLTNKGNIIVCDEYTLKILCGACLNEKFSKNHNSKIMWVDYDNVNHNLYMFKENKEWEVFDLRTFNIGGCQCEK